MLSRDELWEWASEMSVKYSKGLLYVLYQFDLQVGTGCSHKQATEKIERRFENERKKKNFKEET